MNSILLAGMLLAFAQHKCNDGAVRSGQLLCLTDNCKSFVTDNKLQLEFSFPFYHYFKKRSTVGIDCVIRNMTNDTLYLMQDQFLLKSQRQAYRKLPPVDIKGLRVIYYPNAIKINPNSIFEHVIAFESQQKMSFNEYLQLINRDTVTLKYANKDHSTAILHLVYPYGKK